jgi:hypothetical protein
MSRKKAIDFPDLGQLSTLDLLNLLQAGKKLTRTATRGAIEHFTADALEATRRKQSKGKGPIPSKKPKTDYEDLVPPSPEDEPLSADFLEGCVRGQALINRVLWVLEGTELRQAKVLGAEAITGEDEAPKLYKVTFDFADNSAAEWVDLTHQTCFIGSSVVADRFTKETYELLWNLQGTPSYPDLHVRPTNSFILQTKTLHSLSVAYEEDLPPALKSIELRHEGWLSSMKSVSVEHSQLKQYERYFIKLVDKKSARKVLLLRHHPLTSKVFVCRGSALKWEKIDNFSISVDLTEPRVPAALLEQWSYNTALRKTYKEWHLYNTLQFASPPQDIEAVRQQERCKECNYILDALEYLQCSKCHKYWHNQCLEAPLHLSGPRNLWRCKDCPRCVNCWSSLGTFIRCQGCNLTVHEKCLDASVTSPIGAVWRCEECAVCRGCGTKSLEGPVRWNSDLTKCSACESKWRKGEYCVVCLSFWFKNKGEEPEMIFCDACKMWTHITCDVSLTLEVWRQYLANENMEYSCPNCRKASVTSAREALVLKLSQ